MTSPVVLISPAMAVPSWFYRPLEAAFDDVGWEARTVARRGFEEGTPAASRAHDWSYADEIQDVADAVSKVRAEEPGRPVLLLGHSLGGQVSTFHDLLHEPVDGLVLVGVSTPHFRTYPYGGLPVLAMGGIVPLATRAFGFLPKPAFGAPGARTLMREWARWVRTGRPPVHVDRKVSTPSLVVKLQADAYAVSAATDAFVDLALDTTHVTRWTYTRDEAPEDGTTDHVQWVKRPQTVVAKVVAWWADTTS
ncbi:MAG: alpha/beta fold hydrolase [Actinomycetales bacterium]|nr:MAG: alpha/beta fold hydrolase [Actinomycetales bacterium]